MYTMDRWNPGSELMDPQTGRPVTDVKGYLSIYLSEVFRDDRKNIDECIKTQQCSNQQVWSDRNHPHLQSGGEPGLMSAWKIGED